MGLKVVLLFLINLNIGLVLVECKNQYVMPMSMGLKMSLPYDICNVFNRPIFGVTAVILTVALGLIILFGIITSPFGYFFGIPSRKYVLGGPVDHFHSQGSPRMKSDPNLLNFLDMLQNPDFSPSFSKSIFHLVNERDLVNEDCKLLLICYGHGAIHYVPQWLLGFYAIFR